MGRLTATAVKAAKSAGRYGDGDGLFLLVGPTGARSWVCRVQKDGRRRDIGLGSEKKVTLALARERASKVRAQVEAGIDPVAERRKAAGIPSFREAAALVFAENRDTWRNAKHQAQWLSSLDTYAFPQIGDMSVSQIDGPHVRDVLVAIWLAKPETARRVRQRINTVIDWAIAKGYRNAPLPIAALNKSLPKTKTPPKHHAALPYAEIPQFILKLRERESMGRLALEALILTAVRSGEIREATWAEIDIERALWTIPAARMKSGKEHVIPLSDGALRTFQRACEFKVTGSDLVFDGQVRGKPLSDMTLTKVLRDMNLSVTAHGFRSSFRDWVSEETQFDGDVAEMALAHAIENKVEAAYRRGNLLDKRRALMNAWGNFCGGAAANIVRLVEVA
ncbi:MAG: integrase arm-type DNA-binding domain-containing protein [Alphaproteobacteria bacterium]|nr:integrase arm-type DNA-binding domain-containing protein [Alphaproteobacteria bacterium]